MIRLSRRTKNRQDDDVLCLQLRKEEEREATIPAKFTAEMHLAVESAKRRKLFCMKDAWARRRALRT
ncbi:hypothetical protein F2Q69_00025086 [Brassica cretica]|uniref:Uncharacterized protein n=1 Tax=Brassica cretica TaxID=69181 RepID=A0A8S9QBQ6_BRACR|nr:hypothetical protein F2Q69_00025086 [Brassica cretica]